MRFKRKQTSELIQQATKKSHKAMQIFTSAIDELMSANEQLAVARAEDIAERERIEENIQQANKQEEENNRLIVRISSIIGG